MFTLALLISAIDFFISGDLLWGFGCLIALGILWALFFLIKYLKEKHEKKKRAPVHQIYFTPVTKPASEETRKIFAKNLTYYLQLREKTPQDLGRYMQISDEKIESWLNAQEFPNGVEKDQISRYLKISWNKLIKDTVYNDDLIKDQVFKKATLLIYMMNQMSPEDAKTAERYIELLYNQENGY